LFNRIILMRLIAGNGRRERSPAKLDPVFVGTGGDPLSCGLDAVDEGQGA